MKRAKKQSAVAALIRAEVVSWRQWHAPQGASAEEIDACAARRNDYVESVLAVMAWKCKGIDDGRLMSSLGAVLSAVRGSAWKSGVPDADELVARVIERCGVTEAPDLRTVPCESCREAGGAPPLLFGGPLQPVEDAVIRPGDWYKASRAVCGRHDEEDRFWHDMRIWESGDSVTYGGEDRAVQLQRPPCPPAWVVGDPRAQTACDAHPAWVARVNHLRDHGPMEGLTLGQMLERFKMKPLPMERTWR